ncbi:MAG: NAD(P)-dependent oxidoreductase [Candidatus Moraniibacteriota bacterium]
MKKERFFITGGMGYIGSLFAKEALKRGHDVCIYDALIYEQDRTRMLKEISEHKKTSSELKFIIGDTRNTELLEASIKSFKPTHLMHWGDLSSVYSCNHNPTLTEDISYRASCNVVDLCEKMNIKMFFNSTSSVYGVQKANKLMTEKDAVPSPTDNYTKFKLEMEKYIKAKVKKNKKFKIIVFRPATVFGVSPRFRIELLPNHFTYMAVANNLINVSDLNAYRAAVDIAELIQGYFKVIEKGSWKNLIYNIGHHNISKVEFALGVQKVTGCKIGVVPDMGDLRNLQIDCTMFNKEFDFNPIITYEESIKTVADFIKNNLEKIKKSNFSEMLNMPLANWLKISN